LPQSTHSVGMTDPASDGWPAGKVFDNQATGYSYDDLVFMPGFSSFDASEVDMTGKLTKNISLRSPLVGAPCDTVTEADMAIALALSGGMGIIHANQSIPEQCEMVRKVKTHVNGFILQPHVMSPDNSLEDLDKLKEKFGIGTVPITDSGQLAGKLLGIVSSRDADAWEDRTTRLQRVMVRKVVSATEPLTLQDAMEKLKRAKVGKMPILDADGNFMVSMVVRSDLKKMRDYPLMSRDHSGKLLVGAAVPPLPDGSCDWPRASALAAAGANVLYVIGEGLDTQLDLVRKIKAELPTLDVLAGPAVSTREARRLVEAGADGIVAGNGCDAGPDPLAAPLPVAVGRGDATTVYEVAYYMSLNHDIPVTASGARSSSQALIALGLGASVVMMREPLAGAEEAPAGGLHAAQAMLGTYAVREHAPRAEERMGITSRTVASAVPCKGSVLAYVPYLFSGLRNGMTDLGFKDLNALHTGMDNGTLRMECRVHFASQLREACSQASKQAKHLDIMPAYATRGLA